MKKKLAILITTVFLLLNASPAAEAENIYAYLDSGSDYTADQPKDTGDTVQVFDSFTGIQAEINRQTLDDSAFDSLRDYYNDPSLSDRELFKRFYELKKSYINALQALYNPNYLDPGKTGLETAMQIWYEGTETLYGPESCSVYLYNIVQYKGLSNWEYSHLDLVIPDQTGSAVITIKFVIPRSKLKYAFETVNSMTSGFRFKGLAYPIKVPSVLSNKAVMARAGLGVYPAPMQTNPDYTAFEQKDAGYAVSIPTTYVPFVQNSLGGVFTYTSFKIDPNRILSISSEPLKGSGMSDAMVRFKVTSYGKVQILENSTKKFGTQEYSYLSYASSSNGVKQYYQDYYIQKGSRLYKIQLQSSISRPGGLITQQMAKILASFYLSGAGTRTDTDPAAGTGSVAVNKYRNNEEGYSFSYPKTWRLEDVSADIAYDRLRLFIPGVSGALDISVQESDLKQIVTFTDIVKSVNGTSVTSWPDLTVNYDPPFKGRTSKLLHSDFSINGPVSTIYRLSAYMDENGRNRLCYSVDIINGRKLYSMFITTGEYRTESGRFYDNRVNDLINTVASSFRLETTPESEARRLAGETRNRKLVFVETYLKQLIDPRLTISSVDKLQPDRTFYVTVGKTGESGFYKVWLNYSDKRVEIRNTVLKRTILGNEMDTLKKWYAGKKILSATKNESNMTITITSQESTLLSSVVRTYQVDANSDGDTVKWRTTRLARQEDYMWECENFIKSLLAPDAKVAFQSGSVFSDLEPYKQKGTPYRFLTYSDSGRASGFLILSMDPRSSLFTTEGGFLSLDYVVQGIRTKFGIKYLSSKPDAVRFDSSSFIATLRTADKNGVDTSIERYRIQYNPEKAILDYQYVN